MNDRPGKLAHIGICVSDLERSALFYTEALGFIFDHAAEADAEFKGHVELDDLRMHGKIYEREGVIIELTYYDSPGFTGLAERRPMNQLGISHFCFEVDDIDAVVDRIVKFGGKVHSRTRLKAATKGEFVFCTDPDGVRIQLWRSSGTYRKAIRS